MVRYQRIHSLPIFILYLRELVFDPHSLLHLSAPAFPVYMMHNIRSSLVLLLLVLFWLMLNSVPQPANCDPQNLVLNCSVLRCLMHLQMLSFTCLEVGSCSSCKDTLRPTQKGKSQLNCDSDLNKKANKRAIGGRAVKGFPLTRAMLKQL